MFVEYIKVVLPASASEKVTRLVQVSHMPHKHKMRGKGRVPYPFRASNASPQSSAHFNVDTKKITLIYCPVYILIQ
jgi:hypothetical protein